MHDLRSQFPVLERLAYLNAGTNGPVPRPALEAAEASLRRQAEEGRSGSEFFEEMARSGGRAARPRRRAASAPTQAEVALNGSTTDGVNSVLHAHDLRPGDELLTSDEEHPGVLAPLAAARAARRCACGWCPFDELAARSSRTPGWSFARTCPWITGKVVDAAGARRDRGRRSCSTAPRVSARCPST